jgi:hypothetical protein
VSRSAWSFPLPSFLSAPLSIFLSNLPSARSSSAVASVSFPLSAPLPLPPPLSELGVVLLAGAVVSPPHPPTRRRTPKATRRSARLRSLGPSPYVGNAVLLAKSAVAAPAATCCSVPAELLDDSDDGIDHKHCD